MSYTGQNVSKDASYDVSVYADPTTGRRIQVVATDKFPEVPGAVDLVKTWDVDGNPDVFTYKDGDGNTLATRTFTWVGGNNTREVWS